MNDAEKLAQLFEKFPGVGPRQARRFVYHLLRAGKTYRGNLKVAIDGLERNIHTCSLCGRYFTQESHATVCGICGNTNRDASTVMVVEKDADLEQFERSGSYSGHYFILGKLLRLTEAERELARRAELLTRLTQGEVSEVIIALPVTTEGEHTTNALEQAIATLTKPLKVSMLGRGLSTGSELEYADAETLKSALEGRR